MLCPHLIKLKLCVILITSSGGGGGGGDGSGGSFFLACEDLGEYSTIHF